MRAKTCCTVSLKGITVLLRRSHSRNLCAATSHSQHLSCSLTLRATMCSFKHAELWMSKCMCSVKHTVI